MVKKTGRILIFQVTDKKNFPAHEFYTVAEESLDNNKGLTYGGKL